MQHLSVVRLIAHNQSLKGLSLDTPTKDTGNLPPHIKQVVLAGLFSPSRPGGVKSQIRDMFSIRPVVRHIWPRWPECKVSALEPRFPSSKPDSTNDPSCMWVWCMLNLTSRVKLPSAGVAWKLEEGEPA
ncbi:hypothetical protein AVEN_71325-1 [Araneus ventricosus]|uniref:Uncharacterized protein n=1 Tax=Araneus ventricosus TaxID=182803 RepID=A0A4Y2BHD6_ARAVE|nr:hypothetical protein AVEN_71325-1 [Araneus ventricosus]